MSVETIITIALALVSGVGGAAVTYGLTLGRVRGLERDVERLERDKASKEVLDGLKTTLDDLKRDLDKRLDRLEDMLRRQARDPS